MGCVAVRAMGRRARGVCLAGAVAGLGIVGTVTCIVALGASGSLEVVTRLRTGLEGRAEEDERKRGDDEGGRVVVRRTEEEAELFGCVRLVVARYRKVGRFGADSLK